MSRNLRSLAARFNQSASRLASAPRRKVEIPLIVSLDVERKTGSLSKRTETLMVSGFTADASKSGISFVLPCIRLGENYLAGHGGEQKRLNLSLQLSNGAQVRMTVLTCRYEMIEIHDSVQQYKIGAEIIAISESDAGRYFDFLRYGDETFANQQSELSNGFVAPVKEKRSLLNYLSLF
jgi:hypothetical protein